MGVTITPNNNVRYCMDNQLVCTTVIDGEEYEVYPFELNVSNDNWMSIVRGLGLSVHEDQSIGAMDARTLLRALEARLPNFVLAREGYRDVNVIEMGLRHEQLNRYWRELKAIAEEAERREELVAWY